MQALFKEVEKSKQHLRSMFGNSSDFYTKDINICGIDCCICLFENLSSIERLWIMMLDFLSHSDKIKAPSQLFDFIMNSTAVPIERNPVSNYEEARIQLTAGVSLILINGIDKGIVMSTQSFQFRSVQEAAGEGNIRGSREGFTEPLRVNISLIRRLIRTEQLRVEILTAGNKTQTDIALCYNEKLCPKGLVESIKQKIKNSDLPFLLDTGYLAPFLQKKQFSFFSSVGYTERTDTACAKICEGKLVVLANGTPFAMIVPYFFSENFQSMDDYSQKAYFASFIRLLKYFAFLLAIILPGLFVSIANFTPELLPAQLLYRVAAAEQATPLPLLLEAVLITILLEIVREAGLRLPKAIGHSVSLVAALIVGDAAVSAGIVGTPMVIVAAMTAICTFVVPSLYEPVTVLRILFIFAGGLLGPLGIVGLLAVMLFNICGLESFGYSYTSPFAPPQQGAFIDGLVRAPWRRLSKSNFNITRFGKEE